MFWIYAGFAALGLVFIRLRVLETKDRPLEDIDEYWTQGRRWPRRARAKAGEPSVAR